MFRHNHRVFLMSCFMLSASALFGESSHVLASSIDKIAVSTSYGKYENGFFVAIRGQKHRGEGFMEPFGTQSAIGSGNHQTKPDTDSSIQVGDIVSTDDGDYQATQTVTLSAPNVRFEFDSYDIGFMFEAQISDFADALDKSPRAKVLLEGHTDGIGTEVYNLKLSRKRAEAVQDKLEEFGINPSRISVKAYGKTRPIASNATAEGRAQNRRVEMIIIEPI